jgi:hypothetical protein
MDRLMSAARTTMAHLHCSACREGHTRAGLRILIGRRGADVSSKNTMAAPPCM